MRLMAWIWAAVLAAGCCNFVERTNSEPPYVVAEHPYQYTVQVWGDCISAPFRLSGKNGADNVWYAMATVTWPFWLVDELGEVCLDTLFLPADGVYALCAGGGAPTNGVETTEEKVEEVK